MTDHYIVFCYPISPGQNGNRNSLTGYSANYIFLVWLNIILPAAASSIIYNYASLKMIDNILGL